MKRYVSTAESNDDAIAIPMTRPAMAPGVSDEPWVEALLPLAVAALSWAFATPAVVAATAGNSSIEILAACDEVTRTSVVTGAPASVAGDIGPRVRAASRADEMALDADSETCASDVEKAADTLAATLLDTLVDTLLDMRLLTTSAGDLGVLSSPSSSSPSLLLSSFPPAWRFWRWRSSNVVAIGRERATVVGVSNAGWYCLLRSLPFSSFCIIDHSDLISLSNRSSCSLLLSVSVLVVASLSPAPTVDQRDHSNRSAAPDLFILIPYCVLDAILWEGEK